MQLFAIVLQKFQPTINVLFRSLPINYRILKHEEFYAHALVKTWVYFEVLNRVLVYALGNNACIPLLIRSRTDQIRYFKLSRAKKHDFSTKTLKTADPDLQQLSCCYITTPIEPTKNTHDKIFAYHNVITSILFGHMAIKIFAQNCWRHLHFFACYLNSSSQRMGGGGGGGGGKKMPTKKKKHPIFLKFFWAAKKLTNKT